MIFLSAQPDENYFIWQLELQLNNFKEFEINPANIHVLVAYNEALGINPSFLRFAGENAYLASFFYYPDKRTDKIYISSIRPHIIKQHFIQIPELKEKAIFYHDADILFTYSLPDFERLCKGDTWYFSDARSYLDSKYLSSKGPNVLSEMCELLEIDSSLVIANDRNAGGAQCLLKNVDSLFWARLESDCTKLYHHFQVNFNRYKREYLQNPKFNNGKPYVPVASWCSDMWAILWAGLKNKEVRIDRELDFCWAIDDISFWQRNKIFHNAGIDYTSRRRYFYKSDFIELFPYSRNFDFVSKATCSYKYVEKIQEISLIRRGSLERTTVLIIINEKETEIKKIHLALKYIGKFLDIAIVLADFSSEPITDHIIISDKVKYTWYGSGNYTAADKIKIAMAEVKTENTCFYDLEVIIPPREMYEAIQTIQHGHNELSYGCGYLISTVRETILSHFEQSLDVAILDKFLSPNAIEKLASVSFLTINNKYLEQLKPELTKIGTMAFFFKEVVKKAKILGLRVHCENSSPNSGTQTLLTLHKQPSVVDDFAFYISTCNVEKTNLLLQ